jgi:hypothetical protein
MFAPPPPDDYEREWCAESLTTLFKFIKICISSIVSGDYAISFFTDLEFP